MSKKPSGEKKPMPQKVYEAYQQGAREFAKYVIDKIDDGYITNSSDIVDVLAEWQKEVGRTITRWGK